MSGGKCGRIVMLSSAGTLEANIVKAASVSVALHITYHLYVCANMFKDQ